MRPDADARLRLDDIVDSSDAVAQYLEGIEYEEFARDRKTRAATERELITIGEAMRILLQIAPAIDGHVTDAQGIVDFRNVLVHGYRKLDPRTVWAIAKTEVPVLRNEVVALLSAPQP